MGNFKRWLSPLSDHWQKRSQRLQEQIIQRELDLGMVPVFPGFTGHVPDAFLKHYPRSKTAPLVWLFNSSYSSIKLLDSTDPVFANITAKYMSIVNQRYNNSIKAFSIDLYNEMKPPSYKPDYVAPRMKALFSALNASNSEAVWVMQAWLFTDGNWLSQPNASEGLLSSVPTGRLLMLDLYSEASPFYEKTKSYLGQPFIWNMLHNFGGVSGMRGNKNSVNKGIKRSWTFPGSTMVGTGLTMEGMFQNYVMYQLVLDRSWTTSVLDPEKWLANYIAERYGMQTVPSALLDAWRELWNTIYNCDACTEMKPQDIIIHRPSFGMKSSISNVDTPGVFNAATKLFEFLSASNITELDNNYLFALDSVDITRQVMQEAATVYYLKMCKSYQIKDTDLFNSSSAKLLDLLDELDDLLSRHFAFRLSEWLNQAKSAAGDEQERKRHVFGFKNQLTVWGPAAAKLSPYSILDYAAKHWSGLVKHYYRERWQRFQNAVLIALEQKVPFNQAKFNDQVEREVEFVFQATDYPMPANKDPLSKAVAMLRKYIPALKDILPRT